MTAKLYALNPKGEPEPAFRVERDCVVWCPKGYPEGHRLSMPWQFRNLAEVFVRGGWWDHFEALNAAELKLSEPEPVDVVRSMLAASVAEIEGAGQ